MAGQRPPASAAGKLAAGRNSPVPAFECLTGDNHRKSRFFPMQPDVDLQGLMVRYQQGDLAAATALVACLSPLLHRFFMVHTVSRTHADDLLQETWLRLHEARHTYRADQPLLPWLYAIA